MREWDKVKKGTKERIKVLLHEYIIYTIFP
jgi:hypothetical protein